MSSKQQSLFEGARMSMRDSIDLTAQSLTAYGAAYKHWAVAFSGGKDSSTVATLVAHLIETGRVPAPESLTFLYADTRLELMPLYTSAMGILAGMEMRGYKTQVVLPAIDDRYFVYMFGRGVPPPSNTFRWCTPQMNHWKLAIETHNTNFPKTDHVCTDISATDPRRYPSTNILITSPECTNHSLAKGKPRRFYLRDLFGNILIDPAEERSRATMWDVPRFAEYHDYELIVVENVVDAAKWRLWDSWVHAMRSLGYKHQVVYFNSMFAWPTPQSRDRMYTVFWKRGNKTPDLDYRPKAYCAACGQDVGAVQTWKKPLRWGRYQRQYIYCCPGCRREVKPYYYAALNAIDWTIPAERIGDRKKPLKPKTLARIRYGLETYGRKPLIVTGRYTTGVDCRVRDATADVMPTQPGDNSHAVVFPWLVETGYSQDGEDRVISSLSANPTQTARQSSGVVFPWLVKTVRAQDSTCGVQSALDAAWTQTTCQDVGLVAPGFVAELHGTSLAHGLDDPMMCIAASAKHHALLSADAFLTYYYGTQNASAITDPVHSVTTVDRAALVGKLEALTVEDLTFRMLHSTEVGRTMAFQDDYVVLGTERERVKQYGNAVTPPAMEWILQRCAATLA